MKVIFSENDRFYKANLHTHTTVSDGSMTPTELKERYMKAGYSVIAYTDHDMIVPQNELSCENFLAITSMETYYNSNLYEVKPYSVVKTYHLNFLGLDRNNVVCPAFSKRYVEREHTLEYMTPEMERYDYDREYSQECINKIIKEANEAGFLVTLNHPYWSMQNYTDYCDLEGLWGVEVYNHFSHVFGLDSNDQAFVDLINQGKEVFPICGDDCHNDVTSLGCCTMIKADNLEYDTVMGALKRGDFYSSYGPEIKELILDGDKLSFKCSEARRVILNTECRFSAVIGGNGEPVTEGTFNLAPYFEVLNETKDINFRRPYIRIIVEDAQGRRAYTRAYFLDSGFRILA